jgi:putative ABC transport system ATP-binding protein
MGPSGSGKSTLLYNVSGLDRPDGGSVSLAGADLAALSEKELAGIRLARIGFIFQRGNLLRNLSIFDNIILPAYLGGRKKRPELDARAMALMGQAGIAHHRDNDITQVSGGEMQRAAICRALINEPSIVFGDEPTGALNSSAANGIMDILYEINLAGGAILLVTHDAKVAARCERVLFMRDGQIAGEYYLGKYRPSGGESKNREAALAGWLSGMEF